MIMEMVLPEFDAEIFAKPFQIQKIVPKLNCSKLTS